MTTIRETSSSFHFAPDRLDYQKIIDKFKTITRSYVLFHFIFLGTALLEIIFFFFFFSFFAKSSFLAFSVAVIFFTGFAYFILLLYYQAKKPEQLAQLKKTFIDLCLKESFSTEESIFLAQCAYRLVALLQFQEYAYYPLPRYLHSLSPFMEKLSVWTYWKEVHKMKELLLFVAVEEHLKLVKLYPTDLEIHTLLAQSYLILSKLYRDPKKEPSWREGQWVSSEYSSYEMKEKHKAAMKRALEEFKILLHFSPQNPSLYAEIASLYHELAMPNEEKSAYEALLNLTPHHHEVLFRLGVLYFNQGLCAQGLLIYEKLKNAQDPKANALIEHYDTYLTS